MKPGPAAAAALIDSHVGLSAPPRPLIDVLREIIRSQGWFAGDEADEKAAAWLSVFQVRLAEIRQTAIEQTRYIQFDFNSSGTGHIQGACFCEPSDPPDVSQAKTNRALAPEIRAYFESITDAAFEKLCAAVLELLGVDEPFFSQKAGDQGIDFFGRAPFSTILSQTALPAGVEKTLGVWIVGQAKKYKDTVVGTADLRELVGSTQLARAKVYSGPEDPLADLQMRLCDPVFYLLITSGSFTRGSQRLIERAGIIAMDGGQLAQFLADHGRGLKDGAFDVPTFEEWLKSRARPTVVGPEPRSTNPKAGL